MRAAEAAALAERLRTAPPNVLLQREAADAIESLRRVIDQQRREANEAEREFSREARDIAAEARWQERQSADGDYGSY